jgi:quercetin dioxygenase-like cupin family protein
LEGDSVVPNIFEIERAETQAHGGSGRINFARVYGSDGVPFPENSAFNFVDIATLPPGTSVGEHRHDCSTEIYLILQGAGEYLSSSEWIPVKAGDVLVNHCGVHALRNSGIDALTIYVVEASLRR